MQGKGIIKFFLVVMTLVCIVQYFFLVPTQGVENDADEYASSMADNAPQEQKELVKKAARVAYLDSMSSEKVFSIPLLKDYTYEELKKQQLALGLDLKGGMSVILQVDLRDFLLELSKGNKDPTFEKALGKASEAQKNAQSDYITLFADAFREDTGGKKLSSFFIRNEGLREQINLETSDAEVVSILREKATQTVDLTFKRLKDRIDEFGVTQPNVSLDASKDLIIVELPGIDNPERARKFLKATAKLEFWNVFRINDNGIVNSFLEADKKLKRMGVSDTTNINEEPEITVTERYEYKYDSIGNVSDSMLVYDTTALDPLQNALANQGPLFKLFSLNNTGSRGLAVMGAADKNKIRTINEYLSKPEIKALFPRNLEFRWSRTPSKNVEGVLTSQYELYAIKKRPGSDKPALEGDRVVSASEQPDPQTNQIGISLKMDNQGARMWGDMTTKAAQDNNREIAIVLDDKVVSAPRVINPILTGTSSITGDFSLQEAKDIANILEIGKLPAKTSIIQESLVGPSLGKKNISSSMWSMIIGFALVFLFMVFYYGRAGIVSILMLFLNLFFIFGALASYGTVLTVPGVAGILLTIGMAVDANVIIYERIREELREGKSMLMAISDGFKHSYSAIIDANVTTILVAFVLAYFGIGPIKGFAVVLIIGVLSSLFTAVLVGRMLIDWWTVSKGNEMSFWSGATKNAFTNLNIDWLGKRKVAYCISIAIIGLGFVSFFMRGFDLGVDFKGGYSYNIEFDKDIEAEDLRAALTTAFGSTPVVKAVNTENTFNVVTDYLIESTSDDADNQVIEKLHEGVNAMMGGAVPLEQFKNTDSNGTHVTYSSKVGPTIADDIKTNSIYAAVFALLMIFLYIFIRFSKWQYSLGAVAALFHDTLVVLALFSIFWGIAPWSLEIDQTFIAAILTVIGYSINDTVVVFDRIREFMGTYTSKTKEEIINMAINSTVSRTVITSLTTLFVVAILFFFGGSSIKSFAFALLVGIIVGTYSSIFVATPIMSDFSGDLKPKTSDKKKKSSFSRPTSTAK